MFLINHLVSQLLQQLEDFILRYEHSEIIENLLLEYAMMAHWSTYASAMSEITRSMGKCESFVRATLGPLLMAWEVVLSESRIHVLILHIIENALFSSYKICSSIFSFNFTFPLLDRRRNGNRWSKRRADKKQIVKSTTLQCQFLLKEDLMSIKSQ